MTGINILCYIISFAVFIILQSLFINGVNESFSEGNIFYPLRKQLDKYLSEWIKKPLYSCVKCQSSLYGTATLMPSVIYLFGFKIIEIPILIFDIFILVTANFIVYKRV